MLVGGSYLDSTYDRSIEAIRQAGISSQLLAFSILSWLLLMGRVLSVDEMQEVVAIETGLEKITDIHCPDQVTLLGVWAGLVTIERQSNTICLAHYTIKEYLIWKSLLLTDAQEALMEAYLTLLSFRVFAHGPSPTQQDFNRRADSHPFLRYTATQLGYHVRLCDEAVTHDSLINFSIPRRIFDPISKEFGSERSSGVCSGTPPYNLYGSLFM